MIRRPLRPLAAVLRARDEGEDPDQIEHENLHARREALADQSRPRAMMRLGMLSLAYLAGFVLVGARMTSLAASEPQEPRAYNPGPAILQSRADITDRHGNVLAKNLQTQALYAEPDEMIEPVRAAHALAEIFPDFDAEELIEDFTPDRRFIWLRSQMTPEEMQAVHDIGEPGLLFASREMRLYPNGPVASHVMGGAGYGVQGVRAAEINGVAGVERAFEERLRDPSRLDDPLRLSLDLPVQAAVEEVLAGGISLMNAKGASAVLMDIHSGEVVAIASLPDFDPNNRPRPPVEGNQDDSPLFNRAVQGVYELGSVFKPLTAVQALDMGLVNPNTEIDTRGPLRWGRHSIGDFHYYGPRMSVSRVIEKSSNIGTARLAQMIGVEQHRAFLGQLGLLEASSIELTEAAGARPLLPSNWSELSTMTISFGHGLSVSPVMLAEAFASVTNGGHRVRATLLARDPTEEFVPGERVISARASQQIVDILGRVVSEGTASFARGIGYTVGGKTGTADKPRPNGGYYDDRVIASFASIFPMEAPQYVLIVTLDEPVNTTGSEPRRTAGWTAVPVAAETIRRIGPLLGLAPNE